MSEGVEPPMVFLHAAVEGVVGISVGAGDAAGVGGDGALRHFVVGIVDSGDGEIVGHDVASGVMSDG